MRSHRLRRLARKMLRPRILIPILLAAAFFLFAFSITDVPDVMGSIRAIPGHVWLVTLGFAALYLVLKGLEFGLFLRARGFSMSWRQLVVAYAVGELCITIPSGIYAQNYVLNRIDSTSFARSAAATTAMLIIEGTFVLIALVVLGIPGWSWLRPLILSIFAAAFVLLVTLGRVDWTKVLRVPLRPRHWMHALSLGLLKMISELRHLWSLRTLIPAFVLCGGYLFALLAAFVTVAHSVGALHLTFFQAATIYFFALSATMTVGSVLTQVGIMEVVGLSAAQAWGYGLNEGLAMLLGFRIVWTGAIWLLNGVVLFWLRGELRRGTSGDHIEKTDH